MCSLFLLFLVVLVLRVSCCFVRSCVCVCAVCLLCFVDLGVFLVACCGFCVCFVL